MSPHFVSMPLSLKEMDIDDISAIGGYELGVKLGKGAFATVRLARHMITEEKVSMLLSVSKYV